MVKQTIVQLDYDPRRKVFSISGKNNKALALPGGCFYSKKIKPIIINERRCFSHGFVENDGSHAYLIFNYARFNNRELVNVGDAATIKIKNG